MTSISDVLKASKGVPVDDIFAELWGRKLSSDYTIAVYTGTLPVTLMRTKAGYLQRYKVFGNSSSGQECGEKTANLLDIEPGMLDVANWTLRPAASATYFMYYPLSEETIEILKNVGTIAGTTYLITGGSYYSGEILAITSSMKATGVSNAERLLQNDGTSLQYSADVSGYTNIYLCIGYGPGITSSNKQILIDSIFDNYNIMLNAGTVPLSYEPYGYKLPLTSAGQDVDIFIGDDTLSAEEYVDSGTGKIYRMVSGTLTPVDPPIPFPQIPTSANSTTISWAGQGLAPSQVEFEYERK